MTGYHEILTDPSYAGQTVVMTYPLIGNYGVAEEDAESAGAWPEAFVMKEMSSLPSNQRAGGSLSDWLVRNGVVAIEGVDTRRLTKLIRTAGSLRCVVSTLDHDEDSLVKKARAALAYAGIGVIVTVATFLRTAARSTMSSCTSEAAWTISIASAAGIAASMRAPSASATRQATQARRRLPRARIARSASWSEGGSSGNQASTQRASSASTRSLMRAAYCTLSSTGAKRGDRRRAG